MRALVVPTRLSYTIARAYSVAPARHEHALPAARAGSLVRATASSHSLSLRSPSGSLDACLENVTDDSLSTGEMTVGTMATLDCIVAARKNGTLEAARPFFVGVGFHRPHEPEVR